MKQDQQAKHDEVMSLAVNFAIAIREANKFEPDNHSPAREKLSAAIAQLCAKPDSAEQAPVAIVKHYNVGTSGHYAKAETPNVSDPFRHLPEGTALYSAPLNIAQQAPIHGPKELDIVSVSRYHHTLRYMAENNIDGEYVDYADYEEIRNKLIAARGIINECKYNNHAQSNEIDSLQSQLSQAKEDNARLKTITVPTDDDSLWNIAILVASLAGSSLFNVSQKETVTRIRSLFMDPDSAREFIKNELKL